MFDQLLVCIFMFAFCHDPVTPATLPDTDNQDRVPIYAQDLCQENELLYPFRKKEWTCDCRPGYLYYHEKGTCYAAYRQGPCKNGEYLILAGDSSKCEKNPCMIDGMVKYEQTCFPLDKPGGPCKSKSPGGVVGVLTVQEVTFKLDCVSQNATLALVQVPKTSPCSPGMRLTHSNDCRSAITDEDD